MPSILQRCKEVFHTDNLYEVIGVEKDATQKELKKGYHRKSLAFHPDRVSSEDKEVATRKFQLLSQVYSILTDDDRRREYDDTGEVDEESSGDLDRDWTQYWRLLFPKVTAKDIEEFAEKYRGSEEELGDLKKAYVSSEGDMETILDTVLCCTHEDEERFAELLRDLVSTGELPDFDNFSKENKKKKAARIKKSKQEAAEAEEAAKKLKLGDDHSSLVAAIAQRQTSRARQADDFLSQLEAKYCGGTGSGAGGGKKSGKKSKR
ncbi:DnaJ homolog subfamily C member 9 [Elysia marginata]|uniref:DnaJ homolog subfamily C member 9 n=1 Tax=Elysia marginata TaxID=1093978 RepID=A0AAV4HHB7_9GAST|nr:DnaJ homolog subfamily C member 9 [Elysia marginata]